MQISSHTSPLVRTPAVPAPRRRDEMQAEETPTAPMPARPATVGLPDDMLQARLRGRLLDADTSLVSRQALAQYVDVARRDESRGQVEVLGIDAYA